jgi:release factor glutamine methyltransferase
VNVLQAIQRSAEYLAGKGVDSPRLQAELLLAQVLALPRMRLYLEFERPLLEPAIQKLRDLVRRRGHREPLQHLVGSVCFCGLTLAVGPNALIPRPETELLAERGWQFLIELKNRAPGQAPVALDFGVGSGCLALALAAKCDTAVVHGVDISLPALELARTNASSLGLSERVTFHHSDGFNALPPELRFNLIISNPPYIPQAEIESLQPEVRNHDPHVALDGGTDGLDFYRRLAAESRPWLLPGGKIMVEFGDGQEQAVQDLFVRQNWIVDSLVRDYTQRPRILLING